MGKFASLTGSEIPQSVIDRMWKNIAPGQGANGSCYEWQKSVGSHGYGQIGCKGGLGQPRMWLTHRVAWYDAYGPIPAGMTIDHICKNRKCIRPNHLRLLSNVANATDNGQSRKTHCPQGHPYAGSNLYVTPKGDRRCRECARHVHR